MTLFVRQKSDKDDEERFQVVEQEEDLKKQCLEGTMLKISRDSN